MKDAMAELREATTKPCTRQHLFQVGEYQMQDTQLLEPFEVNVAFIMNAYLCFARQTGCRPGMAVNDAADAADSDSHWRASPAERERERRVGRRRWRAMGRDDTEPCRSPAGTSCRR